MISDVDVAAWQEQGFLLVPGVFDDAEIGFMRDAIDAIVERAVLQGSDANHTWSGAFDAADDRRKLTLKGYHNLEYHDACFTRAMTHPGMVAVLQRLIGPNVVLHHSKMLVKPPEQGAAFPMHQDYPYFPHQRHTMLAASVHLDDADEHNGCLHVVPGSHLGGPLEHEGSHHLDHDEHPLESGIAVPAKAGDVLFFTYLTIHGSGVNASDRTRRNVLFQYRDAADLPTELTHVDWGQGLVVCGCNEVFHSWRPRFAVESVGLAAR